MNMVDTPGETCHIDSHRPEDARVDDGPMSPAEAGPDYRLMGVRGAIVIGKVAIPAATGILGFHYFFANLALMTYAAVVIPVGIIAYAYVRKWLTDE